MAAPPPNDSNALVLERPAPAWWGRLGALARPWLLWVALSLLPVPFVGASPLLALAVAGAGGIVLGWRLGSPFEDRAAGVARPAPQAAWWPLLGAGLLGANLGWFLFKDSLPLIGVGAWVGFVLVRRRLTGGWYPPTPLDRPILVLLALTIFSGVLLSLNPDFTYPKVFGLLLGICFYYEVVYALQQPANLSLWLAVLLLLGLGIIALGFVGRGSLLFELFDFSAIERFIPRLALGLPRRSGGLHPNFIAGILALFTPLFIVLPTHRFHSDSRIQALCKGLVFAALAGTAALLMLTQSRGALAGLAVAVGAMVLAARRQYRLALGLIVGALTVLAALVFFGLLPALTTALGLERASAVNLSSFAARQSFWRLALDIVRQYPLTGIGSGTFDYVVKTQFFEQYPGWILATPGGTFPHIHNQLLQAAIDWGLFGLVAYTALFAGSARLAWGAIVGAQGDRMRQRIVLGIAAGLLAHQIFGLTDALYLGGQSGIIVWILLGILASHYLWYHAPRRPAV